MRPPGQLTARELAAASRWPLALFMIVAGIGHFTATEEFLGQTPSFLPLRRPIVWASGVAEIGLGAALALAPPRHRPKVGWALAAFLLAVFPGNIYQAIAGTDAFGLDSPAARWLRLALQPLLIAWALWSSGARPVAAARRT